MHHRRGFTIVEVSVVIFMILLIALIVYPSVTATLRSQEAASFRTRLVTMTQHARQQALQTRRATAIKFDSSGRVGWDFAQDALYDSQGNVLRVTGDENDQVQLGELRNAVELPAGTDFTGYRVGREDVAQSSFAANFYPDGTADRAYLEFSQNGRVFTVVFDPGNGNVEIREESLNDQSENEWDAGELERRVG